ncbi:MAG: hypothetical protein MJB57_13025, partial [Gemmatimonadetes bacterium]|nr:hypothetical protein [Gemmatimonadota bacterium]
MERIEPGRLILAVLVFVACAAPRPAAPRAPVESWSARPADAAPLGRVAEPGPRLIARDTVFVSDVRPDSIEITVDVAEGVTPATVSFREGPTDRDDAFCAPGIPAGTPTPTSRWCPRVVEDVRIWVRVQAQRLLGIISPTGGSFRLFGGSGPAELHAARQRIGATLEYPN